MNWSDDTHDFISTWCPRAKGVCPAAKLTVEKLAGALRASRPLTDDDFEICGTGQLEGCPQACLVRYVASHKQIRLFCDVSPEADDDGLMAFADSFLEDRVTSFPASATPGAVLQATPR